MKAWVADGILLLMEWTEKALPPVRRELPDRRVWELSGYEVNDIHLDYRFGFDCSGTPVAKHFEQRH